MDIKKMKLDVAKDILCAIINSNCTLNDDDGKQVPFNKKNLVETTIEITELLINELEKRNGLF